MSTALVPCSPIVSAFNLTFLCCLQTALNDKNFGDPGELHNLTEHCRQHTEYEDFKRYIKKVIKIMWIDRDKHEPFFQQCNCTHIDPEPDACHQKTKLEFNFYILIWLFVFIFGAVGNFLVLAAFCKSKKLQNKVENHFVVSLAIADLLVIFVIVPIKIDQALHNFNFCSNIYVCRMYWITDHIFFSASILSIFALTISRYITIIRPYDYRKIVNPVAAKLIIVLIWIVALNMGLISNVDVEHNSFDAVKLQTFVCGYRHPEHMKNSYVMYTVVFLIPCFVMLGIYIHIYFITNKHTETIRFDSRRIAKSSSKINNNSHNDGLDGANTTQNGGGFPKKHRRNSSGKISFIIHQSTSFINRKLEARATRVLLLLYGSFIACWFPITIAIFLQAANVIKTVPTSVYAILNILTTLHSTIDPFIYGVLHREFKCTLKKMLGISFLIHQRRGSGANRKSMMNTHRSNLEVPGGSYLGTHRSSDSSFNFNSPRNLHSPRTPEKTDDGYPIYKIRIFDDSTTTDKDAEEFTSLALPPFRKLATPPLIISVTNEDDENIEEDEITDSNNNNVSSCFENDDLIAFTNQDSGDDTNSNDAPKVIEQDHIDNSTHSETTIASKNSDGDESEDTDKLLTMNLPNEVVLLENLKNAASPPSVANNNHYNCNHNMMIAVTNEDGDEMVYGDESGQLDQLLLNHESIRRCVIPERSRILVE